MQQFRIIDGGSDVVVYFKAPTNVQKHGTKPSRYPKIIRCIIGSPCDLSAG